MSHAFRLTRNWSTRLTDKFWFIQQMVYVAQRTPKTNVRNDRGSVKGKGRGVGFMNNEGTANVLRLRESKMEASQRIYWGIQVSSSVLIEMKRKVSWRENAFVGL